MTDELKRARDALKPCPFCGKDHTLIIGAASDLLDYDGEGPYPHSESYAVTCDASRPDGPGGCGAVGGYFPTEAEAIAAWNTRAADAALAGAREPVSGCGIDVERLIAECVPGGAVCDPQQVADAIRRYCNAWPDAAPPAPDAQARDAARYRWLRDWLAKQGLLRALYCQPAPGVTVGDWWVLFPVAVIQGSDPAGYAKDEDAAIDAAMQGDA